MKDTAILVTVCDRPKHARRALESISKIRSHREILVVDDSLSEQFADEHRSIAKDVGAHYIPVVKKRGLACALNIGMSYYLADKTVEWVSYFQDDVDVDPDVLDILRDVQNHKEMPLLTGHHAAEHKAVRQIKRNGVDVVLKKSCRATHMHAHITYWASVMPIPTRELGAPKRVPGAPRGVGSNVDWWIATNAPCSVNHTDRHVACVPGLVRTFLYKREDSTWDNQVVLGEDAPLSRSAVLGWRR